MLFSERQNQVSAQRVSSWMRHKTFQKQPTKISRSRLAKHIGPSLGAEEAKSGILLPTLSTELSGTISMRACSGFSRRDRSLCGLRQAGLLLWDVRVAKLRGHTLIKAKLQRRVFVAGLALAVCCVWRRRTIGTDRKTAVLKVRPKLILPCHTAVE